MMLGLELLHELLSFLAELLELGLNLRVEGLALLLQLLKLGLERVRLAVRTTLAVSGLLGLLPKLFHLRAHLCAEILDLLHQCLPLNFHGGFKLLDLGLALPALSSA